MRFAKLLLLSMCCVLVAPALWGQAAKSQANHGILGYLDPRTGAFRPLAPAVDSDVEPPALTTVGGTITVTLTITLKTTTLTTITCTAGTSVYDDETTSLRGYNESATAAATGSGTTRTCKLTIPYSWGLATASSDSMTTSYDVFGSATTGGTLQRTSGLSPLDTRKVPANGATTALTAAVTL